MRIFNRVPLTSQPQYPAPINWSNPITRGLIADYDHYGRNAVTGELASSVTAQLSACEFGLGRKFVGGAEVERCAPIQVTATNFSTLTLLIPNFSPSSNTRQGIFHSQASVGSVQNRLRLIWLNAASGFYIDTNGGFAATCTPTFSAGTPLVLGFTRSIGATGQFYVNGSPVATTRPVSADSGAPSGKCPMWLGDDVEAATGWRFNGVIVRHLHFSRVLSAGEMQSISANLWQIFQSPPARYFSVASTPPTSTSGPDLGFGPIGSAPIAAPIATAPVITNNIACLMAAGIVAAIHPAASCAPVASLALSAAVVSAAVASAAAQASESMSLSSSADASDSANPAASEAVSVIEMAGASANSAVSAAETMRAGGSVSAQSGASAVAHESIVITETASAAAAALISAAESVALNSSAGVSAPVNPTASQSIAAAIAAVPASSAAVSASLLFHADVSASVSALAAAVAQSVSHGEISAGVTAGSALPVAVAIAGQAVAAAIAQAMPGCAETITFSVSASPFKPQVIARISLDMATREMTITLDARSMSFDMPARSIEFILEPV